jgi:hypothetical protein
MSLYKIKEEFQKVNNKLIPFLKKDKSTRVMKLKMN